MTLTQRKAEVLKEHGVNRISIGVQSFRDEVIGFADRRDREQQALRSIEIAIETGAVVNIGLISGLASKTPESWKYSIAQAISTAVPSITIYKLEIFANTAYYHRLRRKEIFLPSDEEEIEMIRYAIAEFRKADYLPINFFTFTRGGGYVQQHTTNNWHGEGVCRAGIRPPRRSGQQCRHLQGPQNHRPRRRHGTVSRDLRGEFLRTPAPVPRLRWADEANGYGRIVNVSSGRGSFTKLAAEGACYRISKTALNALTCVVADELQRS